MLSISHTVGRQKGHQDQPRTNGRHRPVARPTALANEAQQTRDRERQKDEVLYYYSDEFQHLATADFPVRNHFHVSKADRDRKLVEAMGQRVRSYALIVSVAVLSIAAVLATGAVAAADRAEIARRV